MSSNLSVLQRYSDDQPRDDWGRWTDGGGSGGPDHEVSGSAETFVSPNQGQLTFAQAKDKLNSQHEQALRKASDDIDHALGIKDSVGHPALGAWSDGAEHSLVVRMSNATPAQARVSAAMKGWLANQKSVLLFRPKVGGNQFKATFKAQTFLDKAHADLLQAGLEFHTLEPSQDGIIIHIYGEDQKTLDAVGKIAGQYGTKADVTFGEGEFIGTKSDSGSDQEQRADARREYESIIDEAAASGQLSGRDVGRAWDDIRNRWSGPLSQTEVNWSLTGGGPKGEKWQSVAQGAVKAWHKDNPRVHAETVALNRDLDRAMAEAAQFTDFRDWYDKHRPLATVLFDGQEPYFEKFLAAASINMGGSANVKEALRAMIHFANGGTFEKKNYTGVMGLVRDEYLKIQHEEPLTGPKVVPFYEALMGNWDRVPADRHMRELLFQKPTASGGESGRPQAEAAEAIVSAMADKLGWRHAELQAVLWAVDKSRRENNVTAIIFDYQQYLQKEQARVTALLGAHKQLKSKAAYIRSMNEDQVGDVLQAEIDAYDGARLLLALFQQVHVALGGELTPEAVMDAFQIDLRGKKALARARGLLKVYNEDDHPRDENGRWTDAGGGDGGGGDAGSGGTGSVSGGGDFDFRPGRPMPTQSGYIRVTSRDRDSRDLELFVNPTRGTVERVARESTALTTLLKPELSVRAALDDSGNVFMWKAEDGTHAEVTDALYNSGIKDIHEVTQWWLKDGKLGSEFGPSNEPREWIDTGQTTAKSSDDAAAGSDRYALRPASAERLKLVEATATEAVMASGYNPQKLTISTEPKFFKIGGKYQQQMASSNAANGEITVYSGIPLDTLAPTIAHEVEHQKFRLFLTMALVDHFRQEQGTGSFKEGPAFVAFQKTIVDHWPELRVKDGVTPYSTLYWKDEEQPKEFNWQQTLAINETLAEIASLEREHNGKIPDGVVAPVWMRAYKAVNDYWAAQYPKKLDAAA